MNKTQDALCDLINNNLDLNYKERMVLKLRLLNYSHEAAGREIGVEEGMVMFIENLAIAKLRI